MASIVWYRSDLRVEDHPALAAALRRGPVIPVYVVDPRTLGKTQHGFPRMTGFRAMFLLESLAELRASLRIRGSDLVILSGGPERVLPELALQLGATTVDYSAEVGTEERAVEDSLCQRLKEFGLQGVAHPGRTLLYPEDLPFPLSALPEVFSDFRKGVESYTVVRTPLPAPDSIPSPPLPVTEMPNWEKLRTHPEPLDERAVLPFQGGEKKAWERLKNYFWDSDHLRQYKATRNGLLGADYSSKLSPWLALGCISPRSLHAEVKRYERERGRSEGSYWLIFELLWRDYFQFIALKHGPHLFRRGGIRRLDTYPWESDPSLLAAWCRGETGYPLIDANLRELRRTGYMSNRGRQIVASFLTKNLGLDWRLGAEWFESLLVDYDPASNYGNWNYVAGIGNDAREFRYFHPAVQGEKYDPQARYIRHWLPELCGIPTSLLLRLWEYSPDVLRGHNLTLGHDYPLPLVDFERSLRANENRFRNALPDRRQRLGNYKIKRAAHIHGNKSP